MTSPATITELLVQWRKGDQTALDALLPQVYDQLRRIARRYLRSERPDHTLEPTALVHEAYLRLVDEKTVDWQSRAHFYGIVAVRMRHILVDYARSRQAAKRGGDGARVSLSSASPNERGQDFDILALHEALERLEAFDPQKARIVEVRYFGGLTIEQTAEVLGISAASVKRGWTLARAWLRVEIDDVRR